MHISDYLYYLRIKRPVTNVCISVPLWQIRIFGLFFTPNPDIRILSRFFVQVRIGSYILFSNVK